jgi:hypothetical protein
MIHVTRRADISRHRGVPACSSTEMQPLYSGSKEVVCNNEETSQRIDNDSLRPREEEQALSTPSKNRIGSVRRMFRTVTVTG